MADMSERSTRYVAEKLATLEKRVAAQERSAQMSNRSIESGSLDIYEGDQLVQQVGVQDGEAGVVYVSPIVPPEPSAPLVDALAGAVGVTWDGVTTGPAEAPVFQVNVHLSEIPGAPADGSTLRAVIPAAGGQVVLPSSAGVPTEVQLVAVSPAGTVSGPSPMVTVTPTTVLTTEMIVAGSDGQKPATAPALTLTPQVTDSVLLKWSPVENGLDRVTYEIHESAVADVTEDETSLLADSDSTMAFVPSNPDQVRYYKVVARDADGYGPYSNEVSGTAVKIDVNDLAAAVTDAIDQAGAKADAAQLDADQALVDALAAANDARTAQDKADAAATPAQVATAKQEALDAAALDAQTKADAAETAATAAAALDAESKADAAEAAATATAALDAQGKADAAEQAAKDAAAIYADTVGSGAQQAAIDAAALDAQSKANAAKQAAIDAAAITAQSKADAAEAAATAAAATDAQSKADAAQQAAIAAAATDATNKANQAQSAAESAAALDATSKAETAEANAAATAAADATAKANQAKTDAEAAAQTYSDSVAAGESGAALAAAKTYAEDKADEARIAAESAAALDATSKAETAEANAAATAALDAQSKADAAESAAIAAAATDATTKADAAQSAATNAAALDATAKAEQAEANAAATAALDATTKSNQAKADAETAAAAYADSVAAGESGAALDAAKLYAETKANEAQSAAESAAALDATSKAEQAEADAAATAALDATAKADAAKSSALEYVQSRGTDLVTNGTGGLRTNQNFSSFEFTSADAPPGAIGSFYVDPPSASRPTKFNDEDIPVDANKKYVVAIQARERTPGVASRFYFGLAARDASGASIQPQMYYYKPETMTTLAAPLNPGDTTITVAAITGTWNSYPAFYVGVWDWTDVFGKVWPVATYTRDFPTIASISGNVITLAAPFSGAARPVGTPVSNNAAGGSYMYTTATNDLLSNEWKAFQSGQIGGVHDGATGSATRRFPPGTAFVRLLWLLNYNTQADSAQAFANVSMSDASAANAAAATADQKASDAQNTADSKASPGDVATAKQAAIDAATNAAALDATAKAEQAEANAAATAAADATSKANQAKADAEAAAQTYSDSVSAGEGAAALASAKTYAEEKADAARTAAESAAALDATSKAETAEANAAATAALDATSKANQAQADAEAAAALLAQSKADAAEQAAKDHADTEVATKGKIIPQVSEPTGANRNGNNLWIDTSGSPAKNQPNRWNGSTWVPITDKVASDAATAAYDAQQVADGAASAASTAQSTANGKNSNTWSAAASPPSTVGRTESDIHSKIDGTKTVAQWTIVSGVWEPRTIDGAVLTNVDAASINTGFLNVAILLEAGSIATDKLAAEVLVVSEVYGQDGYFGQIGVGQLAAEAVDGMTVTGAIVRNAAVGQRVQFDDVGLRAFNAASAESARLSAASGSLALTGRLDVVGTIRASNTDNFVDIDENGVTLWTNEPILTDTFNMAIEPVDVAAAPNGSVYLISANADEWPVEIKPDGLVTSQYVASTPGDEIRQAIVADNAGHLYISVNSGSTIEKYNIIGGSLVDRITVGAVTRGLAVDSANNLYVTDFTNKLVLKFNTSGVQVDSWSTTNIAGGIDVDAAGYVYVADLNAYLVRKYDPSGTLLTSWSTTGAPHGLAVDSASNVSVTDTQNFVVRIYSSTGTALDVVPIGVSPAWGLTVDADDSLFAAEQLKRRTFKVVQGINPAAKMDADTGRFVGYGASLKGEVELGDTTAKSLDVEGEGDWPYLRTYAAVGGTWGRLTDQRLGSSGSKYDVVGMDFLTGHPDILECLDYNDATGVWTVLRTGIYQIKFKNKFSPSSSGYRYFYLDFNGSEVDNMGLQSHAAQFTLIYEVPFTKFLAGETISYRVMQNSSAGRDLLGDSNGFLTSTAFEWKGSVGV